MITHKNILHMTISFSFIFIGGTVVHPAHQISRAHAQQPRAFSLKHNWWPDWKWHLLKSEAETVEQKKKE